MPRGPKASNTVDQFIGRRVAVARKLAGLSQEAVGRTVGVTFQQIQKYERGTNRISAGKLAMLAAHLGQPITFFYEGAPVALPADGAASTDLANQLLTAPHGVALARDYITAPAGARRIIAETAHLLAVAHQANGHA
jgi:transcriptional regulator with XRE-family HTH domain